MKLNQSMIFGAVLFALTTPTFAQGHIRQRQVNQQKRIAQGVNSGSLTPGETAHLERREGRLNREIRRDRVDGGGLSPAERAKIASQQNHLSHEIYQEKHDGQTR
jgi:hypothetical protein